MGDPHPLRAVMAGDRLPLTPQEAAEVLRNGRTTTDISTATSCRPWPATRPTGWAH